MLFYYTHYQRNGLDLDTIFSQGSQSNDGAWGDTYNLVYYLLEQMKYHTPELHFGSWCLHSDGGVQHYYITYQWGNYHILISNELYMGKHTNFTSVDHFCEWLNNHSELIDINTRSGGVLQTEKLSTQQ